MAEHDFETVESETVYVGKIFALRADEVRMPGGNTARREVVEHYGAVAIVALDEDANIVMVYQYRHPVGRRLWELPAGLLDMGGEPPHITAARELEEEAGLSAARLARPRRSRQRTGLQRRERAGVPRHRPVRCRQARRPRRRGRSGGAAVRPRRGGRRWR